jgi:hypothetical protein
MVDGHPAPHPLRKQVDETIHDRELARLPPSTPPGSDRQTGTPIPAVPTKRRLTSRLTLHVTNPLESPPAIPNPATAEEAKQPVRARKEQSSAEQRAKARAALRQYLGLVLSWSCGLLCGVAALTSLAFAHTDPVPPLLFVAVSLLLLPPVRKACHDITGLSLTPSARAFVAVALLLLRAFLADPDVAPQTRSSAKQGQAGKEDAPNADQAKKPEEQRVTVPPPYEQPQDQKRPFLPSTERPLEENSPKKIPRKCLSPYRKTFPGQQQPHEDARRERPRPQQEHVSRLR